jgi:hypothetical protein
MFPVLDSISPLIAFTSNLFISFDFIHIFISNSNPSFAYTAHTLRGVVG